MDSGGPVETCIMWTVEAWISTRKKIHGHPPAHCEVYEMSSVGPIYLIDGSSSAAFPCHFCNHLLCTCTGSAVCGAVDVSKAVDTVGRCQLFYAITAGIHTHTHTPV